MMVADIPINQSINSTTLIEQILEYGNRLSEDPLRTLYRSPVLIILVLLALGLPPLIRQMFPEAPKVFNRLY